MPLIAVNKKTGERVNILKYAQPRFELKKGDYKCPICGRDMIIVDGYKHRINHFRHDSSCSWSGENKSKGESDYHLIGKFHVAMEIDKIEKAAGNTNKEDYVIDLEVPFPTIGRIADVCVTYPKTGQIYVHEIQITKIPIRVIKERTDDYHRAGASVVWHLGPNFNDSRIEREILEETGAGCWRIGFEQKKPN